MTTLTRRNILSFLSENRGSLSQDIASHFNKAMFEAEASRTIAFIRAIERELREMKAAGLVERIEGMPERWTRTAAGTKALEPQS